MPPKKTKTNNSEPSVRTSASAKATKKKASAPKRESGSKVKSGSADMQSAASFRSTIVSRAEQEDDDRAKSIIFYNFGEETPSEVQGWSGEWDEDDKPHGGGTLDLSTYSFNCIMEHGVMQGYMLRTKADGTLIIGTCADGKLHGPSLYMRPSGLTFYCECQNGKMLKTFSGLIENNCFSYAFYILTSVMNS
jgi:hypothetical protein